MSKNQQYVEQYKEAAMEQMRRYGIPASVTLAQGILESSNGQSQLARNASKLLLPGLPMEENTDCTQMTNQMRNSVVMPVWVIRMNTIVNS